MESGGKQINSAAERQLLDEKCRICQAFVQKVRFCAAKAGKSKKLRETDSLQQEQESLQGVFLTERDRQFAARNRSRFRVSS